jgi:hypothetical protein
VDAQVAKGERRSRVGSSGPLRRTTHASVMWVNIASAA